MVVSANFKPHQSTSFLRKNRYLRLPGEKATHNHGKETRTFLVNGDALDREPQKRLARNC